MNQRGQTAEIVQRAAKDLVPYVRNTRKNGTVLDQMVVSMREFGFKVPILALSDGTILDGHLRLKAAQKLTIAYRAFLCNRMAPKKAEA